MKPATKTTLEKELAALEVTFKSMPCDNNGNPVCWVTYHRLLGKIEALEAVLLGQNICENEITRF